MEPTPPPDRFERLNQILNDALELPPAEREPYILRACGDDETLRHSAQSLFAMMATVGDRTRTISNKPSLQSGDVLEGGYRIVRMLGRGGMGEVYEAEDPEMDEHVAVKTIRPEIAADEASVARFRKEIQLGRKVSHPNVCNIYSIGKHGSLYFFTMELLTGETLSARIKKRGRMELSEALPLLSQMADALAAAHDAGIIHRDFKPANVMLLDGDTRRKAVVTDFGLARLVERSESESRTGSTHFAGTPAYMAPEQLEDAPLTPATDIYALGLVAYEMVTARRPFEGTSDISAAIQRLTGKPMPPVDWVPELDARWNRAILRCLEREPKDRWESACDFVQALSGAAVTVTIEKPARRKAHAKVWWRWASAAIVALAVAMAVWILREPQRIKPEAKEWLDRGTAAVRDGVYWKATTMLDKALQIDSDLPIAYARRAEAWNEMDAPDRAADDMAKANAHIARVHGTDLLYVHAINSIVAREFGDAVKQYQDILERLPSDQKHFGHVDLGRAYEKNAESPKALAEYKKATEQWPNWPGSWLRRGVLERNLSMLNQARSDLNKALELFREEGDSEGRAQATFELARMASGAQAQELLSEALPLAGENLYQQIAIKLQQSSVAAASGNFEDAKKLASEAEGLADGKGMQVLAARSLVDFGGVLVMFGRPAEAQTYFQRAFDIASRLHAERQQFAALFNLGGLLLNSDPKRAQDDLEQSRTWFAAHGYRKEAASADTLLARIDRNGGDYQGALKRLQAASKEAADPATQGSILRDTASVDLIIEDYPGALDAAQKARQLDIDTGHKRYLAADDELVGTSLSDIGDFPGATEALDHASKEGFPEGDIMLDRAGIALLSGQYGPALELSERVYKSTTDSDDRIDAQLIGCMALTRSGRAPKGRALCEMGLTAVKTSDRPRYASARLDSALAELTSGHPDVALHLTADLLPELEEHNQQGSLWQCFVYRAEAARLKGDNPLGADAAAKGRTALNALASRLGKERMQLYLRRADVVADAATLDALEHTR